jgi:hypothetical protein
VSDDNDGVALHATSHPIQVTEAMLDAGEAMWARTWQEGARPMLRDIYLAMEAAAPILSDISEDALTTATVEFYLDEPTVEAFAIRLALGNNGGEWLKKEDGTSHYTDEQKEHWRQVVRDLSHEVLHAHKMRTVVEDDGR